MKEKPLFARLLGTFGERDTLDAIKAIMRASGAPTELLTETGQKLLIAELVKRHRSMRRHNRRSRAFAAQQKVSAHAE